MIQLHVGSKHMVHTDTHTYTHTHTHTHTHTFVLVVMENASGPRPYICQSTSWWSGWCYFVNFTMIQLHVGSKHMVHTHTHTHTHTRLCWL